MHFGREVTWDINNLKHFESMQATPGGVLIFTIHSGNYDIGASLFAQKFGRTLHTVRVPEQTDELQELRAAELQKTEAKNPHLRVHYNTMDSHLGMELCRILMNAEAVAVQGDRVVTGVSPMEVTYEGLTFKIPRGPLVLAEIARVPCYPIFLQRTGCLRYRIIVGSAFYDGASRVRADDLAQAWLPVLANHLRAHWDQWFVFEHLVSPAPAAP
jgi:lauroyl/myristoyl acyltransferase